MTEVSTVTMTEKVTAARIRGLPEGFVIPGLWRMTDGCREPIRPLCSHWEDTPAGQSADCAQAGVWGRPGNGEAQAYSVYACAQHADWLEQLDIDDIE